jgi:hypothetical protein
MQTDTHPLTHETHTHTLTEETHTAGQQELVFFQPFYLCSHTKRDTQQGKPEFMTKWMECMYVSIRKCVYEYTYVCTRSYVCIRIYVCMDVCTRIHDGVDGSNSTAGVTQRLLLPVGHKNNSIKKKMISVWVCTRVNMCMHVMGVWVCWCMCVDREKEGGEGEGGEGGRAITCVDICRSSEPVCVCVCACVCLCACVCACVTHTLLSDPPSVYLQITFSHTNPADARVCTLPRANTM